MKQKYPLITQFLLMALALLFLHAPPINAQNSNEIKEPAHSIVSPNPVKTNANVYFYNPNKELHRLEIFDMVGNKVKSYEIEEEDFFQIEMGDFRAGMYFYFILKESQKKSLGRILVNR